MSVHAYNNTISTPTAPTIEFDAYNKNYYFYYYYPTTLHACMHITYPELASTMS